GRKRDRADVDREGVRRAVAAAAGEVISVAAEVDGGVGLAAEGAVGDAAGRADPGGAALPGGRLRREGKRGQRRCDECVSHAARFASITCASSASSTLLTCWLTIGWKTRWPIEPIGPAIRTSAVHCMLVRSPSGARLNSVSIATIAPTPWPFDESFAYSIGRSSTFSKLKFSFSPPIPSGTLTDAFQRRSSWI